MQDVHPTATSGDGKVIQQGTSKPGDPPDNRISCAQCGFLFNADRDTEGDSGGDGVSGGTTVVDTVVTISNTEAGLPVHLRGMATFSASSRTVDDPTHGSGCPLCHTWSPRATMRNDRSFESGRDLSNQ